MYHGGAKEFRFDYEFDEQADFWLKFHEVPAVWDEARVRCHAEGAILTSPVTDKLKEAITSFVKEQKRSSPVTAIFTGVHVIFSKGDYSSIDGVPLRRLAVTWAPGEPDNLDNSESCLLMMIYNNGMMADTRCDNVLPYVCYKKYTQLTLTKCGTTDPEYTMSSKTGSCYKFHGRGAPWSEAYMTCVAEGGHLAVINNYVEAAVVTEILYQHQENTPYKEHMFVGFHDWGHYSNNFMTIHGETLETNYNVWGPNEPNNVTNARTGNTGQYCGAISTKGKLDDSGCNTPLAFICEKSPNSLLTF